MRFRRGTRAALVASLLLLAARGQAAEVRPGEALPAVTARDWRGRAVELRKLLGRVTIIDFWASWCQPCRQALPALDAMARRKAAEGLVVVVINIDDRRSQADRFLADHLPHPAVTLLHDPDTAILARFGAAGMPALYVVDRAGIVRLAEAGYEPSRLEAIEAVIEKLLANSGGH